MAPKVPKKPLKSMEKVIAVPIKKMKKEKRNNHGFTTYIFKILKHVSNEQYGINKRAIEIMNSIANDLKEKIASEAGKLVSHGKSTTLTSRDIQTAVKLLTPGQLEIHAKSKAIKALNMYHDTREADMAK